MHPDKGGFDPHSLLNTHSHSVRVKAPQGYEADEPLNSATAIKLVGVLLDAGAYDEIEALMRGAKELQIKESGQDYEF